MRFCKALTITLSGDMVKNWEIAGEIAAGRSFPLLGPQASINTTIKMGPVYYYLLAILYKISFGNYKVAMIIFAVVNSLAILLFYEIVKKFFGEKTALIASFLFAVSKYALEFGALPWNSFFIPLFIIFTFYALTLEKTFWKCLLFGLSTGILFQLHQSTWLVLPVFVFAFVHSVIPTAPRDSRGKWRNPFSRMSIRKRDSSATARSAGWRTAFARNDSKKNGIPLAVFFFLLINLPYIASEVNRGGATIKAIANVFNNLVIKQFNNCDFSFWLANHGHGEKCFQWIRNPLFILRFFSFSLLGTTNIWALLLIVLMLAYFVFKVKTPYKKFILLWLFFPLPVLLIYNSSIFLHYFLMYFPLPFLITALLLKDITGKINLYKDKMSKVKSPKQNTKR